MNPFRRAWPREIGLYLTALALLAQALMGVAHTAHAAAPVDPTICAAEHDHAPALAPAKTCPLCQIPGFAGLLPPAADLCAPISWSAIVHPARNDIVVVTSLVALPPARGPPIPV
jgi:hypothetical protein